MTQKREENIPKFYFCIRAHTFSTHMPCPFKICFTNKVDAICGEGQLLVTGSQGPITRVPGVRIPCPRVASPKAQDFSSRVPRSHVSGSQGPGSQSLESQGLRFLGLRSQGPRSRVSGPDFRLCHFSRVIKKNWRISVFKKQKSHTHQEKKKKFYPFITFLFTPKQ